MNKIYPDFYDSFRCTASSCSDSCCIGWQVMIDDFTLSIYENEESPFGDCIRENISYDEDGDASFIMKDGRCPFLNNHNLCEIFINLGEDKLCDICQAHPRFVNSYGEYEEVGLGLCCEEVCRLIFERNNHITLISREDEDFPDDEELDIDYLEKLRAERDSFLLLLSDNTLSFRDKLLGLLSQFSKKLSRIDCNVNSANSTGDKSSIGCLLSFLSELEYMEDKYISLLQFAEAKGMGEICLTNNQLKYENVLITEIFRYYLDSVWDNDRWANMALAFTFLFSVILCMQGRAEAELIDVVKCLSKNIEYSEQNLEKIKAASENLLTPEFFADILMKL